MAKQKRIAHRELRKWLAKTNTTQAKMARIFGVSQATICHWLAGKRNGPNYARALAIAAWTGGAIPARAWLCDDELEAFDALAAIRAGAKL
jgi:transcriptional regulator with XRE-family HTH domain